MVNVIGLLFTWKHPLHADVLKAGMGLMNFIPIKHCFQANIRSYLNSSDQLVYVILVKQCYPSNTSFAVLQVLLLASTQVNKGIHFMNKMIQQGECISYCVYAADKIKRVMLSKSFKHSEVP
jgi:hypothetical protein